jgi:hypothetical protein
MDIDWHIEVDEFDPPIKKTDEHLYHLVDGTLPRDMRGFISSDGSDYSFDDGALIPDSVSIDLPNKINFYFDKKEYIRQGSISKTIMVNAAGDIYDTKTYEGRAFFSCDESGTCCLSWERPIESGYLQLVFDMRPIEV